jgi:hypothetical protein
MVDRSSLQLPGGECLDSLSSLVLNISDAFVIFFSFVLVVAFLTRQLVLCCVDFCLNTLVDIMPW